MYGYCWLVLKEYTILHSGQIYSLVKRYGGIDRKRKRFQFVKAMCKARYILRIHQDGEEFLSVRPGIQPTGRYQHQIECFWVLLDYLDQVDEHYATGTAFHIAMRIGEREYYIAYVQKGSERFYEREMRRGGTKKYILVVEGVEQIPSLKSDKIASYAHINAKKEVEYYTMGGSNQ